MEFRSLKADEIECFPKLVKENGCMLLLYKDARADMKILDEVLGVENWQRKHKVINNNLFCTVSVWDSDKEQWVEKEDVGVESFSEKKKGQASDAFKRACFNLGIGRELYTAPFIWIKLEDSETYYNKSKKKWQIKKNVNFSVLHIKTKDGKIIELKIEDDTGRNRFSWVKEKDKNNRPDITNYKKKLMKKLHGYKLNNKDIIDIINYEFGKQKINQKEAEKFLDKINESYIETAKEAIKEKIKKKKEEYKEKLKEKDE